MAINSKWIAINYIALKRNLKLKTNNNDNNYNNNE